MLAKKYNNRRVSYPCFIQPKLNGIRGLYLGGDHFQSRSYGLEEERLWRPEIVRDYLAALKKHPYCFDGEFYCHGMSLQQINSRISVNRTTRHAESDKIVYCIFDIISDQPQHRRLEILETLEFKGPVMVIPHYYCVSSTFAEQAYRAFKGDQYEGMIYRDYSAPYGREYNCPNKENRWQCLLKRKEWQDMECVCVGVNISDSHVAIQQPHIGSLQLQTPAGVTFNASGMSNSERIEYYHNPPVGQQVKIKYEMLSDSGKPLKPQVELVYL